MHVPESWAKVEAAYQRALEAPWVEGVPLSKNAGEFVWFDGAYRMLLRVERVSGEFEWRASASLLEGTAAVPLRDVPAPERAELWRRAERLLLPVGQGELWRNEAEKACVTACRRLTEDEVATLPAKVAR